MAKNEVPIADKYTLSFEEAASYFGIGSQKLRAMAAENPRANWLLYIGTHCRIKRKSFETLLESVNAL